VSISWEKAANVKNYLRMKGLEKRGTPLPPMFAKLSKELAKDVEQAGKDYPVDFAGDVEINLGPEVVKQMEEEVEASLHDRCERVWVILNDYSMKGDKLVLSAKELVTFKELQRHIGDMKRGESSIDSKRIIFYFAHLPLDGIWMLVHSHVDAAPFPTGSDISYLPLGWLGLTASLYKGKFCMVPFRADSFEYRGTAPKKEFFEMFSLNLAGHKQKGWYEGDAPSKNDSQQQQ